MNSGAIPEGGEAHTHRHTSGTEKDVLRMGVKLATGEVLKVNVSILTYSYGWIVRVSSANRSLPPWQDTVPKDRHGSEQARSSWFEQARSSWFELVRVKR